MKLQNRKDGGFTIIEVVLVLAIAGLIFLIVFLAVPALQKSQRDTQRKQDLSRMQSQLVNYAANKQGTIPNSQTTLDTFVTTYLASGGETFTDPNGSAYTVTYKSTAPTPPYGGPGVGKVDYFLGGKCGSGGSDPTVTATNTRSFAITIGLEKGDYLCQNN